MTKTIEAVFLIVSTIVGFGVFVLPHALSLSGIFFWLWFLLLIPVIYLLHLAYGEIIFQTESKHNLPGLASKFLGEKFKVPVWLFDFIGNQLVFLVFLIAVSIFVSIIFPIPLIFTKLALFFIVLIVTYFSINPFAKIESVLSLVLIGLFLFVSFYLFPQINLENLFATVENFGNTSLFFSYGILVFALTGYTSIPLVYDLIGKNKKIFQRVNIWALAIVFVLYLLYTISVYGVLGDKVSEESLKSLANVLPGNLIISIVLLAVVSIFTTFLSLAFYLKRGLIDDFGIKRKTAWLLTCLPILFFSVMPLEKVGALANIIGTLFIGVNLIVLLMCYQKIKEAKYFNVSKWVVWVLIAVFGIGWIIGLLW